MRISGGSAQQQNQRLYKRHTEIGGRFYRMVSTDKFTLFGWDDTRNTDKSAPNNVQLGGGLQDIYLSSAQFEAIGSADVSRAAEIALGAAISVAVAGILVVALVAAARPRGSIRRRRAGARSGR